MRQKKTCQDVSVFKYPPVLLSNADDEVVRWEKTYGKRHLIRAIGDGHLASASHGRTATRTAFQAAF